MYIRPDMFLTPDATVEVGRSDLEVTDVFVRLEDIKGAFGIVAYMTIEEAKTLAATLTELTHFESMSFGDVSVYAPKGGLLTELHDTLEAI